MFRPALGSPTSSAWFLTVIKAVHTIVWVFFVGCILAIWAFAGRAEFFNAALSIGIVFVEVVVLAFNNRRCPLSTVATRYTGDSRANFDIYLPQWLAGHTKSIFGTLYVAGIAFTLARWAYAAP